MLLPVIGQCSPDSRGSMRAGMIDDDRDGAGRISSRDILVPEEDSGSWPNAERIGDWRRSMRLLFPLLALCTAAMPAMAQWLDRPWQIGRAHV